MDDLFSGNTAQDRALDRAAVQALGQAPRALIDCDLEEADLSRLDLSGWTFERCNLRRTDVSHAVLRGTNWQSCRGGFANFVGADLSDAVFTASDFNNGAFRRATLEAARFVRCKLTGADLSEVKALDILFDETLLINAKLAGRSFRKGRLVRLDLSQADLRKCDFRMATFEDCSLREALLDGARFEGADLRGADLGGVRLSDASRFRGATISRDQAAMLLGELGLNVR